MAKQIFVNLPVKDLDAAIGFFSALGFAFNPQFTDKNAACMLIAPDIFAMLLVHEFFQPFTPKPIADAKASTEVIVALSLDSKEEVRSIVERAFAAGATNYTEPKEQGFMFQWGFADLDGHIWEFFWMDPSHING
jgi:predicted lactoylglutathione lyase